MLCWLSSWYGCHIPGSSASHPAVCGEKQFVSCSPTPSALHRLLLFHHRKVMLRSPQRTLVWEDGMHLSVHARVSYSRTILIRKQAEQNNKTEQDRASVRLNQQAIFFFFFFCGIILSVLGRIWRGMKMKMRVRYTGKIHLEINGSYSQLSRNVKKKVVLQLFST